MEEPRELVNITVQAQDGEKHGYRINKHNTVIKLLHAHCKNKDLNFKMVNFLLEGERFDYKKTPAQLKLKDGSVIDCLLPVAGGGRSGKLLNACSQYHG
ncbi:hypothetical protein M5689_014563 [Euphorbia peplus]|nr:hypothetical protein M5689_014563 [Euphorbia peplus]